MDALPTAPRSMGGVLEEAVRLYRVSFGRCWSLALVGGVLDAIAGRSQARTLGGLSSLSLSDLSELSPDELLPALANHIQPVLHSHGLWLSGLAQLLIWLLICAALIERQHAAATGLEDSAGAALASALRRLPGALVASVVWALLSAAGLLLVIPGIWVSGMFQLWLVPLCVEARGPLGALGRSWRLVDRHWWYASSIVGIAVTIVALVSMGADVAAGAWVAISHGNSGIFVLASQLLGALLSVFSMPLLTAVMLSLYYDLKRRREARELAVRLRPLQRA